MWRGRENSRSNISISGKVYGHLYFYSEFLHHKRSNSNVFEKFIVYGESINISKIIIPEDAEYSEGNLEQVIVNSENSRSISIPILDVRNNTSKGTHSSKNIKLTDEEIFYLKHLGISSKEIYDLIESSVF